MTLCGLPLSALSSSVLSGCFFVFLVFFGFVVCESVVCAPASFEELDSARASEDPATDRAKAGMNERIRFEDTGRSLRVFVVERSTPVDPMLGYYQRFIYFGMASATASTRHDSCSSDRDRRKTHFPCSAGRRARRARRRVGARARLAGSDLHRRGSVISPSSTPSVASQAVVSRCSAARAYSQAARLEASAPLRGGCRPRPGGWTGEAGGRRNRAHPSLALPSRAPTRVFRSST